MDEPVGMAGEDSVNCGKSVAKGSSADWSGFMMPAPVCVGRGGSVDGDKPVAPGAKVKRLSNS